MIPYPLVVCEHMKVFYESLSEKDRRRYAAVEAEKLGHGGTEYVASVLGCAEKTIRHGRSEVSQLPMEDAEGRVRDAATGTARTCSVYASCRQGPSGPLYSFLYGE